MSGKVKFGINVIKNCTYVTYLLHKLPHPSGTPQIQWMLCNHLSNTEKDRDSQILLKRTMLPLVHNDNIIILHKNSKECRNMTDKTCHESEESPSLGSSTYHIINIEYNRLSGHFYSINSFLKWNLHNHRQHIK